MSMQIELLLSEVAYLSSIMLIRSSTREISRHSCWVTKRQDKMKLEPRPTFPTRWGTELIEILEASEFSRL